MRTIFIVLFLIVGYTSYSQVFSIEYDKGSVTINNEETFYNNKNKVSLDIESLEFILYNNKGDSKAYKILRQTIIDHGNYLTYSIVENDGNIMGVMHDIEFREISIIGLNNNNDTIIYKLIGDKKQH